MIADTYNAPYPDGTMSQGGYASHIRAHEYFTFKIPDNIPSDVAAPMLCAGLTTFSPLYRAGCGPGKKFAILGIGGLGHLAIQWAKALGAEVFALTHSPDKVKEIKELGATEVILTTEENWEKPYAFTFDFILNCADMTNLFDLSKYFSTLAVNGEFHNVGLPDEKLPQLSAFDFAPNGCKIGGSHIGNHQEMDIMLKLASEKGVKTWIERIDIGEKGCQEAVEKLKVNNVHYRFVLVGFEKEFGA
jgi:alcohol dehydrogenase (NADP+)